MPDPDLIPRGREFPSADAPRLDAVLTGARRRRRMHASVVGVVAGGVALVAVLLALPGTSTNSLRTVTPAGGQTAPAGQHPAPATGHNGAPSAGVGRPGQRPSAAPAGNGAAAPTSAPTPGSTAASSSQRPIVGPPHRMTSYDASRGCNGTGPTPATGWCSYYTGATSGQAGQSVALATDVCRLPGQTAAVLTSDNGQQADFSVGKKAYPPVWTWSQGRRFASTATSINVPPGECVEWFVNWPVVDDHGKPLAAGSYDLSAAPMSSPNGDASAAVYNNQTFTVTR